MKYGSLLIVAALCSFTAARADYIANTIKKNNPDRLAMIVSSALTSNSFAITKEDKGRYIWLAEANLKKARIKASQKHYSFGAMAAFDLAFVTAYSLLSLKHGVSIGKEIYKAFKPNNAQANDAPARPHWLTALEFTVLADGIGNFIRNFKDLKKHVMEPRTKAEEELKKAEDVLELVDALPAR